MKTLATLALAASALVGAAALASAPAEARPFDGHGFRGHHFGHHGHWGFRRRHYGWGYGRLGFYAAPVAYAAECYLIRRYGRLIKVCE